MQKSRVGSPGRGNLRPNAGVGRLQPRGVQSRPVLPNRRREQLDACRVNGIVDALDPFRVRTEACGAGQVNRQVYPQMAAGSRRGVNQSREWRGAGQREIAALGETDFRNVLRRKTLDARCDLVRPETRAIDDHAGARRRHRVPVDGNLDTCGRRPQRGNLRAICDGRARRLRVRQQRLHVSVRVDDAGRGRPQGTHDSGAAVRERPACAASNHSISKTPLARALISIISSVANCSAEVATVSLPQRRCAMPRSLAVTVQQVAAGNAQARLERAGFVVDAGMDDFTVARAGMHAELPLALENDHFPAALRQRSRHGETDDTRADYDAVDIVQRRSSL